ncbi:hypothetical protein ACFV2X_46510 [Streptomyces sp. NPDC059679]|uniref:hypothetical protein n=1 Tax=Streptomyces sp. NPDC059679 TaxID=3346903 RepID=UPI00368AF000
MDHHAEATGRMRHDEHCAQWDVFEVEIDGPSHGNPGPTAPGRHGPVRVVDRHHFAYAWTHQVERLRAATRRTLAASGFTKIRMCLLPKAYDYNTDEPELYPFPGSPADGWDTTRFAARFFQRFQNEVRALRELGIESDDRLTRYAVRRVEHGWGNLTGEELVRRCWEGAIRGGYVPAGSRST